MYIYYKSNDHLLNKTKLNYKPQNTIILAKKNIICYQGDFDNLRKTTPEDKLINFISMYTIWTLIIFTLDIYIIFTYYISLYFIFN